MAVVLIRNVTGRRRPIIVRAFDDAMIVDIVDGEGTMRIWSWTSPVVLRWAGWE